MKRICSYCKKDLGEKPPLDNKSITHGICDVCFEKLMKENFEMKMEQYKCLRCGHSWYPRSPNKPQFCASCNSPYWDEVRKTPVTESCPAAKKEESKC